jgi:hypothetical protein
MNGLGAKSRSPRARHAVSTAVGSDKVSLSEQVLFGGIPDVFD